MRNNYKRKFSKGSSKFSKKRTTYEPTYQNFRDSAKTNHAASKDDKVDLGISVVTLKDLPKGTYAIKQSPYDELNQSSTPYPFVTNYNKNVTAAYAGYDNLDGGKTSQYLSSNMSRLLKAVDALNLKVGVNYRFLNLDKDKETAPDRGTRILRLMYDAIVEAMAQLDATSFMELEMVKSYVVGSTVPIMDVTPVKTVQYDAVGEDDDVEYAKTMYFYNDTAAVILLASLEYQILLQQTIANFNSYNKFMTYNNKMLQMNYMREVPILNDLFGQLKKVGFVTKLDSISLSIQGEWIDVDWAQQNNITANQVSRKSDAIIDPVLELSTTYNFIKDIFILSDSADSKASVAALDPTYETYELLKAGITAISQLTNIWDSDSRKVEVKVSADPNVSNVTMTYEQLSKRINTFFSIEDTLKWSRRITNNTTNVITSSTSRFNQITWALDSMNVIVSKLKIQFGDLRTIYEKLAPVGLVNYTKGIKLLRTAVYDGEFKHYLTVESIYKTLFTGVNKLTFNAETGRWQSVALWDKIYGIPLYDAKNGGSFLTFCSKNLEVPVGAEDSANMNLIPAIFTYGLDDQEDGILGVTREGNEIKYDVHLQTFTTPETARLAILPSQDNYNLRFPQPTAYNGGSLVDMSTVEKSFSKLAMMNALNSYCDANNNPDISTDVIAFYEYQLVDIAQPMLSYSKAYGPIKGTNEKPGYIGFAGLTGSARE